MLIFLSWSGDRSKACAEALSNWLPKVINAVRPWISSADIDKGSRWNTEVASKLSEAKFGIVCLTPENLHSDWILFEAGALSKVLNEGRTFTFLVALAPSDVAYPLAQFQHTLANKEEMFSLLKTINKHAETQALSDQHLSEALDVWWPKLEASLAALPEPKNQEKSKRTDRDLLEEMLDLLRNQSRDTRTVAETMTERRNRNLVRDVTLFCERVTPNIEFETVRLIGGEQVFVFASRTGGKFGISVVRGERYHEAYKRLTEFAKEKDAEVSAVREARMPTAQAEATVGDK